MPFFGKPLRVFPEGQDQRSAEDIMDEYLERTSYYDQTLLSAFAAATSVWKKQVNLKSMRSNDAKFFFGSYSMCHARTTTIS